ncbi:MAG: hypothetical protein ACRCT2_14440 [Plesiomonas shigelloides]
MKRFTHDADLRGMVVIRLLGFQLVPFKLYRFRKQCPPELNKLHLRNRQILPAPGITTIKDAKAHLFSRWQPSHLVTITVSHPDNSNLSRLYLGRLANLTELPEHLTKLRQRHNVPGTRINIELRYR